LDAPRLSIGLSLTADLPGAIPQANIIIGLTGNFQGLLRCFFLKSGLRNLLPM
jgi:hypothetical protein